MLFDCLKLALYVIWTVQLAALPPLFLLVWWRERRPTVAAPPDAAPPIPLAYPY